jgi:hypothetical protein
MRIGTVIPRATAVAVAIMALSAGVAPAQGPGGWDPLGNGGIAGTRSLNGAVRALHADGPGLLYVGGSFTDAGGNTSADYVATWNGFTWGALGGMTSFVQAIAAHDGKVYAGGSFVDAGGNGAADRLAVWDGVAWAPFCGTFGGNVDALQIIGSTLYVGGEFQNASGFPEADYLVACDLDSGAPSAVVDDDGGIAGSVYALTADAAGVLYAGGVFNNMDGILAADYVAALDGSGWHALGSSAVTGIVRGLAASGTDVYIGSDGSNIDNIAQADHVAKWDGAGWSALGSDAAGTNGWFQSPAFFFEDMTVAGSQLFVTGSFLDAGGNPAADYVATFSDGAWQSVGSNGAGDGPLNALGLAVAIQGARLFVGGNFTSAGGDSKAQFAASRVVFAVPTPTVTPSPPPVPTPTVTPSPPPAGVTKAAATAAMDKVLTASCPGIAQLIKTGACATAFSAPGAGTLTIQWLSATARPSSAAARKPTLIAAGSKTVSARGKATVKVKLTKAGKRFLRATKKRAKLTTRAVFKDRAGHTYTRTKARTVKRR